MYTRLAFAVAAHLETETLIVDEVLAVGDADSSAVPREDVGGRSGGRTVLSSATTWGDPTSDPALHCPRSGRIRVDAPVDEAIDLYLTQTAEGLTAGSFVRNESRPESQPFFVKR